MWPVGEKPAIPLFSRAAVHGDRTAVVDDTGDSSYRDLLDASARAASVLLAGASDLAEERVAFLVPPGFEYVAVQWGIWRAGGIAVPFAVSHPVGELEYTVDDADASVVVAHPRFADRLRPIAEARGLRFILTTDLLDDAVLERALPGIDADRAAMLLYTSGSTGRPKGVVTTHANIQAQVTTLVDAWGWTPDDRILNTAAAASCPRHHQRHDVRVLDWSGVRIPAVVRTGARLGAAGRRRDHVVHGRPHYLQGIDPRVGVRGRRGKGRHVSGRLPVEAHGVRLRCADGRHLREVEGDHGARAPGALRHDRDRHGAVEPA